MPDLSLRYLDDFTLAYLEAALWSSTDEDGEPLDATYDLSDFAQEALQQANAECEEFQAENYDDLDEASEFGTRGDWSTDEQHGHDFWLTRNGHGAGFWDRGYGKVGDRLTKAAEAYGEIDVYPGDDGLLYFFGD